MQNRKSGGALFLKANACYKRKVKQIALKLFYMLSCKSE